MKKIVIIVSFALLFGAALLIFECGAEKAQLRENIVRLHVIANSDSAEDQAQKLRVRDAVLNYLTPQLEGVTSAEDAKLCIVKSIPQLQGIVTQQLAGEGSNLSVRVSLTETYFDTRYYDTFALPAGIYSSLRIELGEAAGKNWWCVAFPSLCLPAAGQTFHDVAAGAGFSDNLSDTLTQKNKYEIRFFVLDFLGRFEKFFGN